MKTKIITLLIITSVIFALTFIVYIFLREKGIGTAIDILLYVSQAVLAGFITFIGLYITISDQEKKRIEDIQEAKKLRNEEKLKEICPYFFVEHKKTFGLGHVENDAIALTSKSSDSQLMVCCKLENVRKNIAINTTIKSPYHDKQIPLDQNADCTNLILSTSSQHECYFKLFFSDIYGKTYSQKVKYVYNDILKKFFFTIEQPEEDINNEKN